MGPHGALKRVACALAVVCATLHGNVVRAGSVTLTNGITAGTGMFTVSPDDYGSYGFLIGQAFDDEFSAPAQVGNTFTPTYLTGAELYVTTPDNATYSALLSDGKFWHNFVENPPPSPDGIDGPLARTITTGITASGAQATSAFRIADTAAMGIQLDFDLVQTLSYDATAITGQFDQVYTVKNSGTLALSVVFHLAWDPDLFFNGTNKSGDDFVGTPAGVCGVYAHDGDPRWSVALGNGPMSSVPMTYMFAGKKGVVPGTGPAFAPISAPIGEQWIWIDKGMPAEWRNYVVGPGVGAVGESDPALTAADATLGSEYRFPLAAGATETIHIRRYYGTTAIPCFVSSKCGNGTLDPGELCDTTDTPTCNGATCSLSACGDGYTNAAAGESCDTSGADTGNCNGATCSAPSCGDGYANMIAGEVCDDGGDSAACNANCTVAACGDGYANAAAGEACDDGGDSATCNANCTPMACGDGYVNEVAEQCEGGELCDPATCTVTYTLGGGCAGCGTAGDGGGTALFALALVGGWRRRRYCSKNSKNA